VLGGLCPPNTPIYSSSGDYRSFIIPFDHPASDKVVSGDFTKFGALFGADLFGQPAARPETAAGGRVHRRRHIPFQDPALALGIYDWIWNRNGRKQRLGVGMQRILVQITRSAISTIIPRYMTATRSLMWRTMDKSCAMNR
jgi:hypothetical protein